MLSDELVWLDFRYCYCMICLFSKSTENKSRLIMIFSYSISNMDIRCRYFMCLFMSTLSMQLYP